jgi:pimeloyl-ACP methyl ester carboxylesterase
MSQSTKVFVHGVPETSAIWSPLVTELSTRGITNIVLLSPPGFGSPSPAGWGATMYDYRDWLLNELNNIDGPIDLVAHDWGAGHLYNALATQPHIVRSWASDVIGMLHPDYIWHDGALRWQTPDIGEQWVAGMVALSDQDFVDLFAAQGVTPSVAALVKSHVNEDMARCILALYRSAAQPALAAVGKLFTTAAPPNGLAIIAPNDHFAGTVEDMHHVATTVNATTANLDDAGHWWMCSHPEQAASILNEHWANFEN